MESPFVKYFCLKYPLDIKNKAKHLFYSSRPTGKENILSPDAVLRFFLREETERGRKVSEQQAKSAKQRVNPNIGQMTSKPARRHASGSHWKVTERLFWFKFYFYIIRSNKFSVGGEVS